MMKYNLENGHYQICVKLNFTPLTQLIGWFTQSILGPVLCCAACTALFGFWDREGVLRIARPLLTSRNKLRTRHNRLDMSWTKGNQHIHNTMIYSIRIGRPHVSWRMTMIIEHQTLAAASNDKRNTAWTVY